MSPKKTCGVCSLCCKLPAIQELHKHIDTWCNYARPKCGCSLYTERPQECRAFACLWVADETLDDVWFPARAKMFLAFDDRGALRVTVDPSFPNAWRREPYYKQLRAWALSQTVWLRIGHRFIRLDASGAEHETTHTRDFIEGRPDGAPAWDDK